MSRPPRPISTAPTKQALTAQDGVLDYLPLEYDDLVELARRTASAPPVGGIGDFATTLHELSAVVAHILGVYQDRYAGEAFLSTAQSARSLVKHGHRIGYQPDPGTAATGYVHFTASPRAAGELPAGITVTTAPPPGVELQEFQTTAPRQIREAWNRIEVRDEIDDAVSIADRNSVEGRSRLELQGTGYRLVAGELLAIVGSDVRRLVEVATAVEDRARGVTVVQLASPLSDAEAAARAASHQILARPSVETHLFGWDADPVVFPPFELADGTSQSSSGNGGPVDRFTASAVAVPAQPKGGNDTYYYEEQAADPRSIDGYDLFLSEEVPTLRDETCVLARSDDGRDLLLSVDDKAFTIALAFVRSEEVSLPNNNTLTVKRTLTGSVTRMRLKNVLAPMARSDLGMRTRLFGGWRLKASLVFRRPAGVVLQEGSDCWLVGDLTALAPGMLLALSTRDGSVAQIVELTEVASEVFNGATDVAYRAVTTVPASHRWTATDVVVLGNVVPVAHGKLTEQVLGGSDGVTPFLRLALKKAPLSYLASATRVEPDLEVRVDGVRWDPVESFADSTPSDRHYRLERDDAGATTVVFGDGRRGAIPPSGDQHIRAAYRVGRGASGNVAAGRIPRIAKGDPRVVGVRNPVATSGGTDPAGAEDVRSQAARPLRIFDRAVSVSDHADLALLFPGVARTAARFDKDAIELVVAAADGSPLSETRTLLAYLDARRDRSVPLRLRQPEAADVYVELRLEIDPAFDRRHVEDDVRAALSGGAMDDPGMFTFAARGLGQPAHASEIYAQVTAVEGVAFVELLHFALRGSDPSVVNDTVACRPHQWLRLQPSHLDFTIGGLEPSEIRHV